MTQEGKDPREVVPHRPPFLFLERILDHTENSVTAVQTFSPDDPVFQGHFPGRPIVPGVLIVEAMAQALAYIECLRSPDGPTFLTGVDRARFRKPVLPGQRIEIRATVEKRRMGLVFARAEAFVADEKVADAKLIGRA